MNQDEIIKNNKIIAKFMGAYKEKEYISLYQFPFFLPTKAMVSLPEEMQFHSSWDWLMLVVEKIESLGHSVWVGPRNRCVINSDSFVSEYNVSKTKLESVYNSVLNFIKKIDGQHYE